MKLLNELNLNNPSNLQLTDLQKGALASIKASATPNQAYESMVGSITTAKTMESLNNIGLIQVGNNQVILTREGEEALIANNIVDNMGELTEDGKNILDQYEKFKTQNVTNESFLLIKSLNF